MIMFGSMGFPLESAKIVAECYARLPAHPDFLAVSGPFIRAAIEDGIETTTIFEFSDERQDEAIDYLQRRYAVFSAIPTVRASIEEWLGVGAALQVLDEAGSVADVLDILAVRF
jgi:hypothetical protein